MSGKRTPADYAETAAAQAVRDRPLTPREEKLVDAALARYLAWEATQHRDKPEADGARARPGELEKLAKSLERAELRPIVDADLEVIRADCVFCHAQDADPLGIWRPVEMVPRGNRVTTVCHACGHRHERTP